MADEESFNFPEQIPKAQTQATGDAIACSVEETNRIRIAMGLKPLNMAPPKNMPTVVSRDDLRQKAEAVATAARSEQVKERLGRAKQERTIMEVKPLGEDETVDDASSWIAKSRDIESQKKLAAQKAAQLEEEDAIFSAPAKKLDEYTSRHLRGLTVGHSVNEFEEGQTVILTLKDQNVLTDAGDELENIHMLEEQRTKRNLTRKKASKDYKGYDEENDDGTKKILPQYDNDEQPLRSTTLLNDEGAVLQREEERKEEMGRRVNAGALNKILYNLDGAKALAKDFYSADEMSKFKKVKSEGGEKKKKMRRKKKTEDVLGVLEQQTPATNGSQDHGKRDAEAADRKAHAEKLEKLQRFQSAVERATDSVRGFNMERRAGEELVDDDEDLQAALERTRRMKLSEQARRGAESIAQAVMEAREAEVKREADVKEEEDDDDELVTFDPTEEFVRNIHLKKQRERDEPSGVTTHVKRDPDDMDVASDDDTAAQPRKIKVEGERGEEDVDHGEGDAEGAPNGEQEEEEEGEGVSWSEPLASQGMAATLRLLQQKGTLNEEMKTMGRQKDKLIGTGEGATRACEYFDEVSGRRLTTKEAWRRMAHAFHGKRPSLNKKEKYQNALMEETFIQKTQTNSDTPLSTLSKLQERQQKAKSAGIVLNAENAKALGDGIESVQVARPVLVGRATGSKIKDKSKREKVEFGLKRRQADAADQPSKRVKIED